VEIQLGSNFNVSFVTVPIESLFIHFAYFQMMEINLTNTLLYCQKEIGAISLEIV
jgi:hypothetical protein